MTDVDAQVSCLQREVDCLIEKLAEANKIIDDYAQDEPSIVKGALDAQDEAERKFFKVRNEAVQLRAEQAELKAMLEAVTKERDFLKSAYAMAKCSWCDEPVCEKHAAPGEHPVCGKPRMGEPTKVSLGNWLEYARERGYERGFFEHENESLLALERIGLIERNPYTGSPPQWRVTEKGAGHAAEEL